MKIGTEAPAFTLPNQDDEKVSLTELQGSWVVLYFYPCDDTPGCTVEACESTVGLGDFENLDAIDYGCSPDMPEKHRKFIAKNDIEIGLVSDVRTRSWMSTARGARRPSTARRAWA